MSRPDRELIEQGHAVLGEPLCAVLCMTTFRQAQSGAKECESISSALIQSWTKQMRVSAGGAKSSVSACRARLRTGRHRRQRARAVRHTRGSPALWPSLSLAAGHPQRREQP